MKQKNNETERMIYSPLKMTEALRRIGKEYNKKEAILYYAAVLLIAIILGLFFELKPLFLLIVGICYLLFVPQLIYNHKRQSYELQRFNDINAYMSQMAQSFTSNKNILYSIKETAQTFPEGRMQEVLYHAIDVMVSGNNDIVEAKREALRYIQEQYNCEKVANLHEFLLMAEERGGDCDTEFSILEKVRMAWENAVSQYRRKLVEARNTSCVLYGLMLVICVVLMIVLPVKYDVSQMNLVQIVNTIMLSLFIVFFVMLDKRINVSLLRDAKYMTKEKVDSSFAYIQQTTTQVDKKTIVSIVSVVISLLFIYIKFPSPILIAVGIIMILIMANIKRILLTMTISSLKSEIMKAFPKWLFDVMLLMQRESVDAAIIHSVENAPAVLKAELTRISNILLRNPQEADAYMSFLADFNIVAIETSMRKMYSLSVGASGNDDVMKYIIETNLQLLTDSEQKSIAVKGDLSGMFHFLPMLIVSFGLMAYCVAIILRVMDIIRGFY